MCNAKGIQTPPFHTQKALCAETGMLGVTRVILIQGLLSLRTLLLIWAEGKWYNNRISIKKKNSPEKSAKPTSNSFWRTENYDWLAMYSNLPSTEPDVWFKLNVCLIGKNKEERNEVMKRRKREGEIFLFKTLQRCSIAVNKIVFLTGSSNTSWSHLCCSSKLTCLYYTVTYAWKITLSSGPLSLQAIYDIPRTSHILFPHPVIFLTTLNLSTHLSK